MTNTNYDAVRRYDLANAGVALLSQKNMPGARKTLDKLLASFGWDEDDASGLLAGMDVASDKGAQAAILTYAQKSAERRGRLSLEELPTFFDQDFGKYVPKKNQDKTRAYFASFGKTLGEMRKELGVANSRLDPKYRANFSEGQIKAAEKTQKKYEDLAFMIQSFEQAEIDRMVRPIQTASIKDQFKEITDGLPNAA